MIAYIYNRVPQYIIDGFRASRTVFEHLHNVLQVCECINYYSELKVVDLRDGFDIIVFGSHNPRVLVKKANGFSCIQLPFQIIDDGETISLVLADFGEIVDGRFASLMRSALNTALESNISTDDISLTLAESFGLDVQTACLYCDIFFHLVSQDHGYFRFDDDEINQNGDIHPRYHLDFFLNNTSSFKIGLDRPIEIETIISMLDPSKPKWYLRK